MSEDTIKIFSQHDGYQIVYKDEVIDFIPYKDVVVVERPDLYIGQKIRNCQKRVFVRRFVNNLKEG